MNEEVGNALASQGVNLFPIYGWYVAVEKDSYSGTEAGPLYSTEVGVMNNFIRRMAFVYPRCLVAG